MFRRTGTDTIHENCVVDDCHPPVGTGNTKKSIVKTGVYKTKVEEILSDHLSWNLYRPLGTLKPYTSRERPLGQSPKCRTLFLKKKNKTVKVERDSRKGKTTAY